MALDSTTIHTATFIPKVAKMCLQHSQEKNKWLEVLVLLYRCCCLVAKLCLCNPVDLQDPPGSSVYGIFQQEYWSGWPFPFSGDLPDPEIKPTSLSLLHCHVGYYHWATREARWLSYCFKKMKSHKDIPKHTRTYRIKPPWAFLQKPAWLKSRQQTEKGQRCTETSLKHRTKLKYLCIFNSCGYGYRR